uniref:Uncharacterized protein n=1 Tax=Ditylenchus dipsaci TaxID=166011 RepID=A0A915E3S6_9BILA
MDSTTTSQKEKRGLERSPSAPAVLEKRQKASEDDRVGVNSKSIVTVHFNHCFPFVWQSIDSPGPEATISILLPNPGFHICHQLFQALKNFSHSQGAVEMVVCGCLSR